MFLAFPVLDGSADPPPRPVRTMPGASIKAAGHRELRLLHGPVEGFNPAFNWLFKPAAGDASLESRGNRNGTPRTVPGTLK
jgi:hypothetical protein